MGNPSIGVPIPHLIIADNLEFLEVRTIDTYVAFTKNMVAINNMYSKFILKWIENHKTQNLWKK